MPKRAFLTVAIVSSLMSSCKPGDQGTADPNLFRTEDVFSNAECHQGSLLLSITRKTDDDAFFALMETENNQKRLIVDGRLYSRLNWKFGVNASFGRSTTWISSQVMDEDYNKSGPRTLRTVDYKSPRIVYDEKTKKIDFSFGDVKFVNVQCLKMP